MIKHSTILTVGLINLIGLCLFQWYVASLLNDGMGLTNFHLFIPLILVDMNMLLWFVGQKIQFYQYWLLLYAGYAFSILLFYTVLYMDIDAAAGEGLPPGEVYWDLFLFVFIYAFMQLIIFCFLHIVTYILYRLFKKLFLLSVNSSL